MSTFRMVIAFALASTVAVAGAGELWIQDRFLGASLLRVDLESGARTVVDLDSYPMVIGVGPGAVAPSGELYLEAVNAVQLSTVVRYDPRSGETVGISGWVDDTGPDPRGTGPGLEPGVAALTMGPWGVLYVLREGAGPMAIDVATGDRRVVSQSAAPAVGDGVELLEPVDLVVEREGWLLVADRFAALVRVAVDGGARRIAYAFPDLIEGPHRIDRLPDGRVVHAFGAGDGRQITVFDRGLGRASELSGPNRGAGPGLGGIVDLAVAPDGTVYLLDIALGAVIAVDPESGDRTVVSDDRNLTGDEVALASLSPRTRLLGFEVPRAPPAPRSPARRLARPAAGG